MQVKCGTVIFIYVVCVGELPTEAKVTRGVLFVIERVWVRILACTIKTHRYRI